MSVGCGVVPELAAGLRVSFLHTVDTLGAHYLLDGEAGGEAAGRPWTGWPVVWRGIFPCSLLVIVLGFQLRAAEVEIKDLQSEFQLEKIDYLATIRRQERDSMLFQQLLEQVQPLIRRDCNYSNLDRIRRESCWDEDSGFWKIPEPIIIKTSLPVGQELSCPMDLPASFTVGRCAEGKGAWPLPAGFGCNRRMTLGTPHAGPLGGTPPVPFHRRRLFSSCFLIAVPTGQQNKSARKTSAPYNGEPNMVRPMGAGRVGRGLCSHSEGASVATGKGATFIMPKD
ncbi:hypothetical protein GHT09_002094 [Marmota monax]|uniref:Uncharacterized protein n=1 Tax=Marmota monax TaxID=9995 RepID=A0A834PU25_MARMO|nr:hypothetical protein GHT09_002094 [Marmota monax]